MKSVFSFKCVQCGKVHEGSPSIASRAPFHWMKAHENDASGTSKLDEDLCMIERRDYFIRCILEVPIHGVDEPFLWGVWVSQSEANFRHYLETFADCPEHETFGYFSNRLTGYPDTVGLETKTHWRPGKDRPWIELQPSDHPLYRDWSKGISWERATELAAPFMHPSRGQSD